MESFTACSRNMSSSKSNKKPNLSAEEWFDMDLEIPNPNEGQRDDPIQVVDTVEEVKEEKEEKEEETQRVQSKSKPHLKAKSKGKAVAKIYTKRSKCWNHFNEIKENGKRVASECKYYGIIYKADSSKNGTKNLKNHHTKCPENLANKSKLVQSQLVFEKDENNEGESKLKSWVLNPEDARSAITQMIIMDELPFSHIEKAGFRHLMSVVCPGLNMPSRTTIIGDVYHLYVDERVKLKDYLVHACQRVCVTTDTWTSLQRINYMCVTAHFVDHNWKLQKRILNFCTISSHKGDDIAIVLRKCLEGWGLSSKLYTVTMDNARYNNTACVALIDDLKSHGCFLFSGGEFLYVTCIAHILNLVVWDGLKVMGKSLKHIRAAVRFIRQSPSRLKRFEECALLEKIESKASLCLDVPTRWNSTYQMLSTALIYERAFTRYAKEDPFYNVDLSKSGEADRPPNASDWKQVKFLLPFLETCYNVALLLSGTYVTSNLLFFEIVTIHKMIQHLESLDEYIEIDEESEESRCGITSFKEMAKRMRTIYNKYYGTPDKMNPLVYIGLIFDPRYKLAGLEVCVHDMFGELHGGVIIKKVKEKVEALFDEYWNLYKPSPPQSGPRDGTCPQSQVSGVSICGTSYAEQVRKKLKASDRIVKTELQKYMNEEPVDDQEVGDDVLGWWMVHGPRYPMIARMARDVLAVPVSTVASESAFSTGEHTLDPFRTSLTPRIVQALICVQDWLKPSSKIDIEESFEDLQIVEEGFGKFSLNDNVIDVVDSLNN